MLRVAVVLALAGCGASSSSSSRGTSEDERAEQRAAQERAERARIVAHHRELESAQQDALGATCTDMARWAKQQCSPSCYPLETADPRAGTKLPGAMAVTHHVCQRRGETAWILVDEVGLGALTVQRHRGALPKKPKRDSWQADVIAALATKDFVEVPATRQTVTHPLTHESLECVTVTHVTSGAGGKLDACAGTNKKTTCEAAGDTAARGLNLVHFRLAEARQNQTAGKHDACQAAALSAIATARGLPRWRQYAKLNVGEWREGLTYRTRFDGLLDEDALFARAQALGAEAEAVYAACGGSRAATTPTQEHAFHSCAR